MAGDPARLERPQSARPGPPRARGGPASHSVRPSARAVSWGGRPRCETHVGVRGSCSRPGLGGDVTSSSQGGRDPALARSRSPRARVHADGIPTQNQPGQSPRTHTQPYTYTHTFPAGHLVPGPGSRPGGRPSGMVIRMNDSPLACRRGSQSGPPLPMPDCDARYVAQQPEEWALVGHGQAATMAAALRPGNASQAPSESGPEPGPRLGRPCPGRETSESVGADRPHRRQSVSRVGRTVSPARRANARCAMVEQLRWRPL